MEKDVRNRSCGLAIFANGTSSRRAQEHSTTASPPPRISARSAGLITVEPFGLWDRGG